MVENDHEDYAIIKRGKYHEIVHIIPKKYKKVLFQ